VEQSLAHTIALLERTPAALDGLLRGLPDEWIFTNEGGDTWNSFGVVGHLIFGEQTDWMPRVKMILQFAGTRAFEPFDRAGHVRQSEGKSLDQLLDEFARLRAANLAELRALNLGPKELALPGRHPGLGSVTLAQLLAAWVGHDLTHLHQVSRILAHQYREAAGPWSAYMGVMQCGGHSS